MSIRENWIVIKPVDVTKLTDAELLELHNKLITEERYEGCKYTQEEMDKRKIGIDSKDKTKG